MILEPFFSVSPLRPFVNTYDPDHPNAPYAYASMGNFGGSTFHFNFETQCNNNEIIIGDDPVDPTDQTIGDITADIIRRCAFTFFLRGYNITRENQYLMLFSLRSYNYPAPVIAQFFVGWELVSSEPVIGDDQVAILMDVPGDQIFVPVYVRLASTDWYASLGCRGMDCFLL